MQNPINRKESNLSPIPLDYVEFRHLAQINYLCFFYS